MRRILITNDDGIDSDGLRSLAVAAGKFGEVYVVAPDGQRSAMSHCFTYLEPLMIKEYDLGIPGVKAFSCSGTPADCVRAAVIKLLPERPDTVFAGINNGFNIGWDIQYSATIGAVMEAASLGIHAAAFSRDAGAGDELIDRYLEDIMDELIRTPLDNNQVWNVNFPKGSVDECRGILRNCKVSTDRFYADDYTDEILPDGTHKMMIVPKRVWTSTPGTDLDAVLNGYISVGTVNNLG